MDEYLLYPNIKWHKDLQITYKWKKAFKGERNIQGS